MWIPAFAGMTERKRLDFDGLKKLTKTESFERSFWTFQSAAFSPTPFFFKFLEKTGLLMY